MSYELPVANGSYVVRLHFAEIYWGVPGGNINGGVGLREMSVAMEGQSRLVNFDPTLEAGEATAIIKNFPVTVADGKLSINFSSTVDRPMVCGVEVYKFNTAANKLTLQDAESGFIKIRAYPNPVRNSLQVEVVSPRADNYELQLIDALGRIYELGKTKLPKGTSHLQINIGGSSLKPGFYFLRANTRSSKPELIKLILE